MNTRPLNTTLLAAFGTAFALAATPVLGAEVSDDSFDEEVQAIGEDLQRHDEIGAFGRAGDIPAEEALPGNAVRDRDIDRYVDHLGMELRMRNEMADREAGRVQ